MRVRLAVVIVFAAVTVASQPIIAGGQAEKNSTTAEQVAALERTVLELRNEVRQLSRLLRAALPPGPVADVSAFDFEIKGAPTKGSKDAPLAIVEFSDFQCPFCRQHFQTAYQGITTRFVDAGRVLYVFRHLPLEPLHPAAKNAAQAAECAGEQNKFWEMHDLLFADQQHLDDASFGQRAEKLSLNPEAFKACLDSGRTRGKVDSDFRLAEGLEVQSTPTFLVGTVQPNGYIKVLKRISGARPFQEFSEVFEELLQTPGSK